MARRLRDFVREFCTSIGGPVAAPERLWAGALMRLLLVIPLVNLPTLVTILRTDTSAAHAPQHIVVIRTAWIAIFALYVVAVAAILASRRRRPALERALTYGCVVGEMTVNQLIMIGGGTLTSHIIVFVVLAVAVYRVFFDYHLALATAVLGWALYLGVGVSELVGLLPVSPALSGIIAHPSYQPAIAVAQLIVVTAGIFITFGATNYGVNQALKLHRYITESVLRRYLPPSLVARAARGELRLDLPPERRTVTVLFTDLVEFTPLSERLGASAVGDLLNRYLSMMADIAHSHGGTVDKFVGDAIMIVFGAPEPLAPSEQARRCVQLALEMHAAMSRLDDQLPLLARSGINTGEAVVGNFGSLARSDYTVIGPAVNIAARLESASSPGRILIGPETAALLDGAIPLEPAGALTLKGVSTPIRAWLIAERAVAERGVSDAPPLDPRRR